METKKALKQKKGKKPTNNSRHISLGGANDE